MRKYLVEFREFINKGDVVTIAVGLILALYFAKIVDAILNGVILQIIAAIFSEPDFSGIGFFLGDAFISIGAVINALISFLVVAFILYLIIRAYNRFRGPTEPGGPTEAELLVEIRDELRAQRQMPPPPPPR